MQRIYLNLIWLAAIILLFSSCQEKEYMVPAAGTDLQNDCIKRSLGPNLVGQKLEFIYAMALPQDQGKLVSAQVEATIAGASGTYLEHRSYYTNASGVDIGIAVGNPSVTNGTKTEVTFVKDTCAAALRYYYVIPEEARGGTVSFKFSVKASNGKTLSYNMGPYTVAKMEMKLDMVLSDNNLSYLSIANMQVYNATDAVANAGKIDLVYLYRVITGITFAHALVSPAADPSYLPGITLPAGVNNSARIIKTFALRDQQLARLQYGIFIDDLDFQSVDFNGAPDFAINLKADAGTWVETADGKYRAYIFINSINNTAKTMTVSIKRYTMK